MLDGYALHLQDPTRDSLLLLRYGVILVTSLYLCGYTCIEMRVLFRRRVRLSCVCVCRKCVSVCVAWQDLCAASDGCMHVASRCAAEASNRFTVRPQVDSDDAGKGDSKGKGKGGARSGGSDAGYARGRLPPATASAAAPFFRQDAWARFSLGALTSVKSSHGMLDQGSKSPNQGPGQATTSVRHQGSQPPRAPSSGLWRPLSRHPSSLSRTVYFANASYMTSASKLTRLFEKAGPTAQPVAHPDGQCGQRARAGYSCRGGCAERVARS